MSEISIEDLRVRRSILEEIIRQAKADNDPRIDEPKRQLKIIVSKINKKLGLPEPKDTTVCLDSINLVSRFNQ